MTRRAAFRLLLVTGLAFLVVRALLDSQFRNSTLLYLAVPFGISVLLNQLTSRSERPSLGWRYLDHLRDATIILLATSAFLYEGFLCVLIFMPIYYLGVTIGFAFMFLAERWRGDGRRFGAFLIPPIVGVLSLEGVSDLLSARRDEEVGASAVLEGSIDALQANMAEPIVFTGQRHWFLSVFPLPTHVEAGTLQTGDVHNLAFTYKRWFFTNVHQGTMRVRLVEVTRGRILTEIVEDTSYLSHYMRIEGTEVRFADLGANRTRVRLTVRFRRLLDPSWYFGPLERFAVRQSARYLIDSIIARRPSS